MYVSCALRLTDIPGNRLAVLECETHTKRRLQHVIDEADGLPGCHIAGGFSGHGFGIGPGSGKALAALLTGDDVGLDVEAFRLGRLADGTPTRPETGV